MQKLLNASVKSKQDWDLDQAFLVGTQQLLRFDTQL